MHLAWTVNVRSDGSCVVPPGRSDGEIDAADCVYPSVADALADLYDAVISEHVALGVSVSLRFEAAS